MIYNYLEKILILKIPLSLTYIWNIGSILGFCLIVQIRSGFLLVTNYINYFKLTFAACTNLFNNFDLAWLVHNIHTNGASFFFFAIFVHIWRGIYYGRWSKKLLWTSGVSLFLLNIITAFLGYVLPWGQISYWGTTVITGLFSVLPVVGDYILIYIWGDLVVGETTLTRFIRLHFILPFVILLLIIIHLNLLHIKGSGNSMGISNNRNKIYFYPLFIIKDLWPLIRILLLLFYFVLLDPNKFGDVENYVEANYIITPVHIQPEWYFLFAYAILRSIPNKTGGVLALVMSVLIYYLFILCNRNWLRNDNIFIKQILFYIYLRLFVLLTYIGAIPVEHPFNLIRAVASFCYFTVLIIILLIN